MTRTRPRAILRTLITGVAIAVATVLLTAFPASAHDRLIGSDPVDGARLEAAPEALTLTFSDSVQQLGASVSLVDAEGSEIHTDEPVIAGPELTVPLPDDVPAGEYRARWRVVSSDGHAISGILTFSVAENAQQTTSPSSDGDGPTATAGETSAPDAATSTSGTADADAADQATPEDGLDMRVVLIGLAGAVVALILLALVHRVRTRGRSS